MKKRWIIILLVIVLLIAIAGERMLSNQKKENVSQEIVLEENQEYIYVTIKQILGNEMHVYPTNGDANQVTVWQIPVGVDVVTKLGTTTTFSRLQSGDNLKMIIENTGNSNEIIKIWIVQ